MSSVRIGASRLNMCAGARICFFLGVVGYPQEYSRRAAGRATELAAVTPRVLVMSASNFWILMAPKKVVEAIRS
jgi:hypothetical protein